MKKIFILGAGGFAQEVLWTINDLNQTAAGLSLYVVLGFLDERPFKWKTLYKNYPVLDPSKIKPIEGSAIMHGISDGYLKERFVKEFQERGFSFETLIHPSAIIADQSGISSKGVVIQAGNILSFCEVQDHALINIDCTIGHDSTIGRYSNLSPGVHVSGDCTIGERVQIGTGAVLREKIKVGNDSVIGMGAVVVNDVPEGVIVMGVPAKIVKRKEAK